MYNATGDLPCYKLDLSGPAAGNSGAWDWQWCSQMLAQELPYYPATGRTDMFWDQVGGMGSVGRVGKGRLDERKDGRAGSMGVQAKCDDIGHGVLGTGLQQTGDKGGNGSSRMATQWIMRYLWMALCRTVVL